MSRRFQFSLTSLLAMTAIVAVAVNWWTLSQRVIAARHKYEATKADYSVGLARRDRVAEASKELLQAELAVPFSSDRRAWFAYLNRTRHLRRLTHAAFTFSDTDSEEYWKDLERSQDQLLQECRDVENRLGLPHADEHDAHVRRDAGATQADTADDDSPRSDEVAPPPPDE